jgi:hypothetical protein
VISTATTTSGEGGFFHGHLPGVKILSLPIGATASLLSFDKYFATISQRDNYE